MYVCKVKVTQSCPTLCDPMNYTFHGILQARILEWVAFPFSEDLPDPRIRLGSPALQADSFPTEPSGKPHVYVCQFLIIQWGVCTHTHTHIHIYQFSSVAQLCSTLLRHHRLQHARLPCPSPTPGAYSDSCPLSQWCHPTISSSVIPFSCLQSFPASGSFPMRLLFASGGQSIGVSASACPSDEYSELISLRMDWLDLLAVQGTLKNLLQHHSSKASILWHSAFFTIQLSHPYVTTGVKKKKKHIFD